MICPNCGRELPDHAHTCSGCSTVLHIARRRRTELQIDDSQASVRVHRQVKPDENAARYRGEASEAGRRSAGPVQQNGNGTQTHARYDISGDNRVPVGLHKQAMREQGAVRHVRHAPDRIRKKVDAQPAMLKPPIYRKSHKTLRRALYVILFAAVCVFAACGYFLLETDPGQRMMAQWEWNLADTGSYVALGQEYVEQAYFTKALHTLGIALEREPNNVDALVLMAQAHTELGQIEEAKAIYVSLIERIAPEHPSAYRNLIKIYQSEGYNAEALALMRQAEEATNANEFVVMLREYTPKTPTLSMNEGRYNEEIDVTITVPEGQTVYYTTDGTDPSEAGLIYKEGTAIHIPEGKMTIKAIGFMDNGTPSEQVEANYTVIIPTPAAPKANYASGSYPRSVKVSLRPGSEDESENEKIVAIYYTLDGRQATTESTLFDPDNPIQLPIGKTTLRAVSVHENGKVSYEMSVSYDVEGNLKYMFREQDTFKNMELYKTGYNTFTKAWGTPSSYELLPEDQWYDEEMESYEAVYDWGTARFVKKSSGSSVLYALDTTSTKMTAPRSTKVGMSGEDVMAKFQDLGQAPLDEDGNRLLYNLNSGGYKFGTYRKEADGRYALHYYYPVDDNHTIFVELSYYLNSEGDVERVIWQRYVSEL